MARAQSFLDDEGFPRADIDIVGVLRLRGRLVSLRSEYREVLGKLDTAMQAYFAAAAGEDPDHPHSSDNDPPFRILVPPGPLRPTLCVSTPHPPRHQGIKREGAPRAPLRPPAGDKGRGRSTPHVAADSATRTRLLLSRGHVGDVTVCV